MERKDNQKVLVDANIFAALYNKDDTLHKPASERWAELKQQRVLLHTTDLVINEALTTLRRRAGKQPAVELGRIIFHQTQILKIVRMTPTLKQRAFKLFQEVDIKDFSFTDAALIALKEQYGFQIESFDETLNKIATRRSSA